jgi:outer membrane protein TolC
VLPSPSNNVPAGIPAQLLARRLDIAASVLRVRAADALVAEGKAGLLPRVSLTGSSGTSSNELKSLINGDFLTWSFGGSLAQTILLRDERNVRVHERELMTEEAVLNHRSVVMTAFEEVERALSKNVHLSEYRKQLNTVAEGTSDILVLARGRYENGTGSLKELMEAQNRSVESRAQLVAAQRQELENRVDLHLSLGGGFDLKEAENEASTSD